ncbi:MAG: hypothetical protein M3O36_02965, partial [Myxococcota bacterium]|nr:hypothetical protein [Myxococcota bacterium]
DTSMPTTIVGTGTASSCTEQALAAAVAKGGIITFYCGSATIKVTQTIQLPIDKDTVIDGANKVSLDGGGKTRILQFMGPGSRATTTSVTLQHLDIVHGNATPGACSQGNTDAGGTGGGGGIFVHDGKLHVIDVRFTDNQSTGPSVGGGAIYAEASLDVTAVGSTFTSNGGSNGGAIRSVNSDLTLVDDTFATNQATGSGCGVDGGSVDGGQSPNGGNSGAIGVSGTTDGPLTVCGCVFASNSAVGYGGALGRSADGVMQTVSIDQTTFDGNTASQGGAMNIHNCNLDITASTISNNSASGAGGIQADNTKINFVNDTFAGNATTATTGIGGAMTLLGNGGTIQSCTFADNHADHVPGAFAAAIAGGVTLTINDTIFWDNTSQECMSPMTCQTGSSTGQADLQWPSHHIACTMPPDPACAAGGTTFADANLSPIGWNGGPTQTLLPGAGSPANGAGTACPMTDQRGVSRKADGCTVGAVEMQ